MTQPMENLILLVRVSFSQRDLCDQIYFSNVRRELQCHGERTMLLLQLKQRRLTANTTVGIINPTVNSSGGGGKTLTIKAGSADSFDFAVSYLNIKKEVTT